MESKLEAYRLRKRRIETFERIKNKFINMIPFYHKHNETDAGEQNKDSITVKVNTPPSSPNSKYNKKEKKPTISEIEKRKQLFLLSSQQQGISDDEDQSFTEEDTEAEIEKDPFVPENKWLQYFYYFVFFLFWATCYAIAIELKFGIFFLLLSAIFGVYFNTRTGPKKRGEISAYSVFNKDCESIDGTLKAEQFEREIRYGSASVR